MQFVLTYKRGQYTQDHAIAMKDLRKHIGASACLTRISRSGSSITLQTDIRCRKKGGERHTGSTEALTRRLTAVARELQKKERTKTPRKGEVLLVTVPFREDGAVGITNTHRVTLNQTDPCGFSRRNRKKRSYLDNHDLRGHIQSSRIRRLSTED